MIKPNPKIFRLAAKRLSIPIEECLLIDDIGAYCDAARTEGMKAILYENFEQMKQDIEALLAGKA